MLFAIRDSWSRSNSAVSACSRSLCPITNLTILTTRRPSSHYRLLSAFRCSPLTPFVTITTAPRASTSVPHERPLCHAGSGVVAASLRRSASLVPTLATSPMLGLCPAASPMLGLSPAASLTLGV
jgi:hypothetical protein